MSGPRAPRRSRAGALLAILLAAAPAARADTFLGGDWTTGRNYRGFDVRGGVDLDAHGDWEADGEFAYAHSKTGTESRSRQATLTLVHTLDDHWSSRGGMTGWRDSLNDIQYFGPSFGVTYTAFAPSREEGGDESHGPDTLRVSLDSDLFVYQAGQTTSPRVISLSRSQTVVIPAGQGEVSLAQWHPYVLVEKPLAGGRVTPWVELAHSFYSKSPGLIEQRAGRPQFSSSSGSLDGLVGGLLQNTGVIGTNLKLGAGLKLTASLGAEQQATDNSWSVTQGAGLSETIADSAKLGVSWARSIQDGVPQDLTTFSAAWFF